MLRKSARKYLCRKGPMILFAERLWKFSIALKGHISIKMHVEIARTSTITESSRGVFCIIETGNWQYEIMRWKCRHSTQNFKKGKNINLSKYQVILIYFNILLKYVTRAKMRKTSISPFNLICYIRVWWNTSYMVSVFTLILREVFLNRCSRDFSHSTTFQLLEKRYISQILNRKDRRTVACKCKNAGNAFGCLAKILLLCCKINDSTLKMINCKVRCSLFARREALLSLHTLLWSDIILWSFSILAQIRVSAVTSDPPCPDVRIRRRVVSRGGWE